MRIVLQGGVSPFVELFRSLSMISTQTAATKLDRERKVSSAAEPPETNTNSAWALAFEPTLFSVLRTFFMLNLLNTAGNVVFILFAYTSIEAGGLSRSVRFYRVFHL